MHRKNTFTLGFTLIELLVVISIVSLLSSVVVASLSTARDKARIAAGQQFSGQIKRSVPALLFFDFNGVTSISNLSQNQKGEINLSGSSVSSNGPIGFISDTTLYGGGNHLSVTPAGASAIVYNNVSNLGVALDTFNYTLSGWIRFPSQNYSSPEGQIISAGGGNVSNQLRICITPSGSITGLLWFPINNNNGTPGNTCNVAAPASVSNNQWAFIAVSVKNLGSGNVEVSFFVNGQSIGTWPELGLSTTPNFSNNFNLGTWWNGGTVYLDDVSIFGAPLTAMEVQRLYAVGAAERGLAVK